MLIEYSEENDLVKDIPSVGACLQKQSHVTSSSVGSGHADDEADQTHADRTNDVPELLLVSVGAKGHAEGEEAGEHPWRRAHEKGGNVAESESLG